MKMFVSGFHFLKLFILFLPITHEDTDWRTQNCHQKVHLIVKKTCHSHKNRSVAEDGDCWFCFEHACTHMCIILRGVMSSCPLQHQLRDQKQERNAYKNQELENERQTIINREFEGKWKNLSALDDDSGFFLFDNSDLRYEKLCSFFLWGQFRPRCTTVCFDAASVNRKASAKAHCLLLLLQTVWLMWLPGSAQPNSLRLVHALWE